MWQCGHAGGNAGYIGALYIPVGVLVQGFFRVSSEFSVCLSPEPSFLREKWGGEACGDNTCRVCLLGESVRVRVCACDVVIVKAPVVKLLLVALGFVGGSFMGLWVAELFAGVV
jgi:hypothetical protein